MNESTENTITNNNDEKKVNKFKIGKTVLIIFAITLLILMIITASKKKDAAQFSLFLTPGNASVVSVSENKLTDTQITGVNASSVRYSANKTSCIFFGYENKNAVLYYMPSESKKIVLHYPTVRYTLSYDGSVAVYISENKTLYACYADSTEATPIAENVIEYAVSPEGKCILYSVGTEKTEAGITTQEKTLYLYNGKTVFSITEDYSPIGVSDDGKYIYIYNNNDNSLCMLKKDGTLKAKLSSNTEKFTMYLSRSLDHIIFSDGEYSYISIDSGNKARLAHQSVYPVSPTGISFSCNSDNSAKILDSEKFTDGYLASTDASSGYNLYYVDKKEQVTAVAGDAVKFRITKNNTLVFLSSEKQITTFRKEVTTEIQEAEDFEVSSDSNYIYALSSGSLYSIHNSNSIQLASGVSNIYITGKDVILLIMSDGSLYYAKEKYAGDLIDKNVYICTIGENSAYYLKNYDANTGLFDIYYSDGSDKFSEVGSGLLWII